MTPIVDPRIEHYATEHTTEESELLRRLARETEQTMELPQMMTGRLEGTFLRLLVRMLAARRVLEIGTFTGYGALSMAAGLPDDGRLITCEIDPRAAAIAEKYFRQSRDGNKIELRRGAALETLAQLDGPFDFVFIDADKKSYPQYYERSMGLVRDGGIIAIDNVLWSGKVLDPPDEDAQAIASLNDRIRRDGRVEHVLATIRDGILIVYKKPVR